MSLLIGSLFLSIDSIDSQPMEFNSKVKERLYTGNVYISKMKYSMNNSKARELHDEKSKAALVRSTKDLNTNDINKTVTSKLFEELPKIDRLVSRKKEEWKSLERDLIQAIFKEKTYVQLILLDVHPISILDDVTIQIAQLKRKMQIKSEEIKKLLACKSQLRLTSFKPVVEEFIDCHCTC